MSKRLISYDTLRFLKDLRANNNREWFSEHHQQYKRAREEVKALIEALRLSMSRSDQIEGTRLFRVHRDLRFTKDKTPYNPWFSVSLSRLKPFLRGGYFLRIEPGKNILACGFWDLIPDDLKLIRASFAYEYDMVDTLLADNSIKEAFGKLQGEQVKTAPKGYPKDHPAIHLLRYKQLIFSCELSDEEIVSVSLVDRCVERWRTVRPFFDYMSHVLTHNLNGEPLYL